MNLEQARTNMLTQQLRTWGVTDQQVLNKISSTPREEFVPSRYRNEDYADMAIPLDHNQSMLTPKEEARLLQALAIKPHEYVLEVGTGSGYMTALLARCAQHVYSVDIFADFTAQAMQKLKKLTFSNVEEGEDIKVWVLDCEEVFEFVANGRINNAISIIAVQWLQLNKASIQKQWLK
jgi:protein-L-isoaspartate(D-aspartate) O-methyltransferase